MRCGLRQTGFPNKEPLSLRTEDFQRYDRARRLATIDSSTDGLKMSYGMQCNACGRLWEGELWVKRVEAVVNTANGFKMALEAQDKERRASVGMDKCSEDIQTRGCW